jgi:uncharacterized protein
MALEKLPEFFVPARLADHGVRLCGSFAVSGMARLRDCLAEAEGAVAAEFAFFRDEVGRRFGEGAISVTVRVQCQRCMEPMDLALRSEIKVQLMEGAATAQLRPGYEAWAPGGGPVSLIQFVEEELLLALPMAPMHDEEQCVAGPWQQYLKEPAGARPFADLLQARGSHQAKSFIK